MSSSHLPFKVMNGTAAVLHLVPHRQHGQARRPVRQRPSSSARAVRAAASISGRSDSSRRWPATWPSGTDFTHTSTWFSAQENSSASSASSCGMSRASTAQAKAAGSDDLVAQHATSATPSSAIKRVSE
jgi:hypothetical protein